MQFSINNCAKSTHSPCVTSALLLSVPAAQSLRGSCSSYERLRDEVPSCECTAHDTLTNQSAFVNEVDVDAKFETNDYDLYPITQELHVHPCVPEQLWSPHLSRDTVMKYWSSCIECYRRADDKDYYTDVLQGDLDLRWPVPLFGTKHNALTPVLKLSALAAHHDCPDAKQFVLHFITMVVLQYYIVARRQFLQASADRDGEFRDSRSPWIFAVFLRYDIKKGAFQLDLKRGQLDEAKSQLLHAAKEYDLSSLLRAVLGLLAPSIAEYSPALNISHSELDTWSMNKVFVTKTQLLVTSHFVPMRVKNYTHNILKSMKQDTTHSANAITQDQLTKHFRLIKHHKMHELKFKGKEPLRNASDQFDQRKSTTELSFMQTRIPTFFCHFWFSPTAPLVTFDYIQDFKNDAYCSILQTLDSVRRVVDGTLLSTVSKHCMRCVERVGVQYREQYKRLNCELKRRRGKVDLVRLRYAYCIRKYQMVTQLADHFSAHRHAETAPLYISPAALQWFATRDRCRSPLDSGQLSHMLQDGYLPLRLWHGTHAQELPVYYHSNLSIEPGTHDYIALCHAVMALAGPDAQWATAMEINWHLAMRGLVTLMSSEAEAFCLVLKLMRLATSYSQLAPDEALEVVKRHYLTHRDACSAAVTQLVANDGEAKNSLALTMRQWRHHSELDQGDVDGELLFSAKLYLKLAENWFERQGVDSILARAAPDRKALPGCELLQSVACWLAGDATSLDDWPLDTTRCYTPTMDQIWSLQQVIQNVKNSALHQSSLVSGHLAMQCPTFHIQASKSTNWRELQAFEADMPHSSELLHRLIEKTRSQEFEDELSMTVEKLKKSPTFRVSSTGRASLYACMYLLQQVDVNLRHSKPDARELKLRQLLKEATTLRIDQAFPVVEATRQEALSRAAKRLSMRLQMSDDSTLSAVQQSVDWLAQYYDHNVDALCQAMLKVFTLCSPLCREQLHEFQAQCLATARRHECARSDMVLRLELIQRPSHKLMLALGRAAVAATATATATATHKV